MTEDGTSVGAVTPEQRPHPRLELGEVERLDQVVVGTVVEPADTIVECIAGGEHEHPGWLVTEGGIGVGAEGPTYLTPVDVGQVEVEAHQVVFGRSKPIQSPAPSPATSTAYPSRRSPRATAAARSGSSSTTRIRIPKRYRWTDRTTECGQVDVKTAAGRRQTADRSRRLAVLSKYQPPSGRQTAAEGWLFCLSTKYQVPSTNS